MTILLSTPITGSAQTGFTTPGYTLTLDKAPDASTGVQHAITGITGTQAGVRTHTPSDPFTFTFEKPRVYATLSGLQSGVTGLYGKVGENVHRIRVRKGVNIAANNLPRLMTIEALVRIPAGADSYDAANVRAAISAMIGGLTQVSAGMGDTYVTGVL